MSGVASENDVSSHNICADSREKCRVCGQTSSCPESFGDPSKITFVMKKEVWFVAIEQRTLRRDQVSWTHLPVASADGRTLYLLEFLSSNGLRLFDSFNIADSKLLNAVGVRRKPKQGYKSLRQLLRTLNKYASFDKTYQVGIVSIRHTSMDGMSFAFDLSAEYCRMDGMSFTRDRDSKELLACVGSPCGMSCTPIRVSDLHLVCDVLRSQNYIAKESCCIKITRRSPNPLEAVTKRRAPGQFAPLINDLAREWLQLREALQDTRLPAALFHIIEGYVNFNGVGESKLATMFEGNLAYDTAPHPLHVVDAVADFEPLIAQRLAPCISAIGNNCRLAVSSVADLELP